MAACIRIATFACLLLAGTALAQSGGVYQWKDAQGVTHYSDAPPPQGQYQARDIHHRDGADEDREVQLVRHSPSAAPRRAASRSGSGDSRSF